ncbi:YeiH family protein [Ligilactobacillus ceti]|uniref:Sulfate exporter family transporter n=1 Tax=Ligilactobacillus ceti DSM 22408 TaxID=1122146 RepID=A0A0R2KIT0_9LACO|nr:putative sulfate exporter family transporter [Ligilactobacillus ceti]KRN89083.1 hypothetical protein IV53_GL001056 [Ligilactobacillus ceti DSM 22408]
MKIMKEKTFWLAAVLTLTCSMLGVTIAKIPYLNLIGALVLSMLLGMLLQSAPKTINKARPGIGFISNKFLRLGIILLGFKLNLVTLAQSGVKTIVIAMIVVTCTIFLTYKLCMYFGADSELAILTATGCGICGAAAVMGMSPQIETFDEERKRENEVLAVAVASVMGTLFILIELTLKSFLHLSDAQFGIMAGGSLHEIAQAVAAGGAGGAVSLQHAIIMKLSRVLLLAPAALVVGIWYQKHLQKEMQATSGKQIKLKKLPIPWFMAGFILSSLIGTFMPIPESVINFLVQAAYVFLGMAMAALGMSVNFKVLFKRGQSVFKGAFISSTILLIFMLLVSIYLF